MVFETAGMNCLIDKFFDVESYKLLYEKIEVLFALKDGKAISEIPKFYDILELYPQYREILKYDANCLVTMWD